MRCGGQQGALNGNSKGGLSDTLPEGKTRLLVESEVQESEFRGVVIGQIKPLSLVLDRKNSGAGEAHSGRCRGIAQTTDRLLESRVRAH